MPPLQHPADKKSPPPAQKLGDRIATGIFRVLVGAVGSGVLFLVIYFRVDWKTLVPGIGFFALTFGYAFGGNKWAARLFNILHGYIHRIPEESAPPRKADPKK
jgi:TM2 domain-containing membrane protein YozV